MIDLSTLGVNETRSPEENISIIKGWADNLLDSIEWEITQLEDEIDLLRSEIESLKEEKK